MIKKEDLEKVISEKIEPLIDSSMHKFMGVTIKEISADISDKLKRTPLLDYRIVTSLPFKKAKKLFRKEYIKRLLQLNQGNISDAARISGIDRRSIHRVTQSIKKDVRGMRRELKESYKIDSVITSMIQESLHSFEEAIQPKKLDNMYRNVTNLSKDILKEIPVVQLTLKEAIQEFEKEYLKKALKENSGNVSKTAKLVGLRAETFFRKIKRLGLN